MMNLSPMAAGGEGFNGMQGNWEEVGGDWHQAESRWGLAAHRERGVLWLGRAGIFVVAAVETDCAGRQLALGV
jgi:hypothetical protein